MSNFFENRVLNIVTPFLKAGQRAEFFNNSGTLFVTAEPAEMEFIKAALTKAGVGEIKVYWCGEEFAIDFI